MSACLFMIGDYFFIDKTDQEIQECIDHWISHTTNYDTNNPYESDQAIGFRNNIESAKIELECRSAGTTHSNIQNIVMRELRNGSPNIKQAIFEAHRNGEGFLICGTEIGHAFKFISVADLKAKLK